MVVLGLILCPIHIDNLHTNLIQMKTINLFYLIGIVAYLTSCSPSKEVVHTEVLTIDNEFEFEFVNTNSLNLVLDKAHKENKLVFIDFYAHWCLPCKMMEDDVFTHEPTAQIINADFVSYKINAEKDHGRLLASKYNVSSYPTLIFLDSDGNILERKDGIAYHSELLRLAESAKTKAAVTASLK